MTTQITQSEIIETIAKLKGWNVSDITNIDLVNGTFVKSKGEYSFELTPSKKMVKANSIKFLWTVSSVENCSYN